MKKKLFTLLFLVLSTTCFAQFDSTIFKGTLTNKEYNVYLKIDFTTKTSKFPDRKYLAIWLASSATTKMDENG